MGISHKTLQHQEIHWLKVRAWNFNEDVRKILKYVDAHQSSIRLYYENNVVDGSVIIELMCDQNYDDLELDVNSGSSGISRLKRKPRNISQSNKDIDFLKKIIEK